MAYKKRTFYDLKNSPLTTHIELDNQDEYIFYFSTEYHHKKFDDNVLQYVQEQKERFETEYGCKLETDIIFYIKYYKMVEKRRMYIKDIKYNQEITDGYSLNFDINSK